MVDYETKAKEVRRKVLEMIFKGQTSHIGSNLSVIDIATVLYANLKANNEVVWSKGWAAATAYYFLSEQGKIPKEDLDKFPNAPYLGLIEPSVNGVQVASGSMGHGLPVAVGMAMAKKLKGEDGTIYCIMSDGEMNEGTTWESAAIASHHKLDNLVVIVDKNGWQAMGRTDEVLNYDSIADKFEAFNWEAVNVNGHDYKEIETVLRLTGNSPYCIVAKTIKGKGVSFMEDHLIYHYKYLSLDEYERALAELS